MWPFRRKQQQSTDIEIPREVQEYYQAEKRERVGIAWLLAFGTLVVTVAVIVGLFFGGRWVYRKVANTGEKKTTTSDQSGSQPEQAPASPSGNQPSASTPSTPSSSTPSGATNQPPSPTTGKVPNTGPGDVVGIFAATTASSTLAYHYVTSRRRKHLG